jgi:hypothetical protein
MDIELHMRFDVELSEQFRGQFPPALIGDKTYKAGSATIVVHDQGKAGHAYELICEKAVPSGFASQLVTRGSFELHTNEKLALGRRRIKLGNFTVERADVITADEDSPYQRIIRVQIVTDKKCFVLGMMMACQRAVVLVEAKASKAFDRE